MPSVLLVGATGLTGREVLKLLLLEEEIEQVTVFSRKPLGFNHEKLVQEVVDFDHLHRVKSQVKADVVISCLGTTIRKAGSQQEFLKVDLDYVQRIATFAHNNNVKQFLVISSLNASVHSKNFYLRTKGQMENALKAFPFEGLHIFRPSLLAGERKEFRVGEQLGLTLANLFPFLFLGPTKKYKPISAYTVAKAMMLVCLKAPKGVHTYPSERIQKMSDTQEVDQM